MRKDKYQNNAVKFYEKILLSKYNKSVEVIKFLIEKEWSL